MKLFSTILICLFFSLTINAQDTDYQNTYFVGGTINFSAQSGNSQSLYSNFVNNYNSIIYSSNGDVTLNYSFTTIPLFGKVINQHWTLGLLLDYRISQFKADNYVNVFNGIVNIASLESKNNQYGGGVFGRYYVNPQSKLSFYIQPYIKYNFIQNINYYNDDLSQDRSVNYLDIGIATGLVYNINNRFRIIGNIGGISYLRGTIKDNRLDTKENASNFTTNFRLSSVAFGCEFLF